MECGELTFLLDTEEVKFSNCASLKRPKEVVVMLIIDVKGACISEVPIEERMSVKSLAAVTMNFIEDEIERHENIVHILQGTGSKPFTTKKLDLYMQNRPTLPTKPFIEEPLTVELKELPQNFRYVFWGSGNSSYHCGCRPSGRICYNIIGGPSKVQKIHYLDHPLRIRTHKIKL